MPSPIYVMGYFWFADRDLYGKYGLYKVPTTAGWTERRMPRGEGHRKAGYRKTVRPD